MARIRTIKPEFFTSEQIVECSTSARLLFVGMWCFCDDAGIHPASVKRLKMEVFPGDAMTDQQIQSLINELIANNLIAEFQAGNERFWHVTGWKKHQKIDRPSFKYPSPDDPNSTSPRRAFDEHSTSPRDGMESNGMESNGMENTCSEVPKTRPSEPPPVMTFPTAGKTTSWDLVQSKIDEYTETYPGVDIVSECRKARQWAIDKPKQRKTASGMGAFLNSWLSKAQNEQGRQQTKPSTPHEKLMAEMNGKGASSA